MTADLRRAGLFALYQLMLIVAIALMPVALVARRVGLSLDLPGRAVESLGRAYDRSDERA
ncbi:MAG: hypothetical protein ABEJ61_00340 [Haloferacaceae archaeon]